MALPGQPEDIAPEHFETQRDAATLLADTLLEDCRPLSTDAQPQHPEDLVDSVLAEAIIEDAEEESAQAVGEPPVAAGRERQAELVLERHQEWDATLPLGVHVLGETWPRRRDSESREAHQRFEASGMVVLSPTKPGTAPSATRRASWDCWGGTSRSARTWTGHWSRSSRQSTGWGSRVGRGGNQKECPVAIRPYLLPRVDGFPCSRSGKRVICANDQLIRIFIRLPGRARLGLWMMPDTPVGPQPKPKGNRFTDFWGEDADERGPYAGRQCREESGRLTPLRGLMMQRSMMEELNRAETAASSASPRSPPFSARSPMSPGNTLFDRTASSGFTITGSSGARESLKSLVELATGVPVNRQKLVLGPGGGELKDNAKAICDYEVGQGALLLLSVKPEKGQMPGHVDQYTADFIVARMKEFVQGSVGPKKGADLALSLPELKFTAQSDLDTPFPLEEDPYFAKSLSARLRSTVKSARQRAVKFPAQAFVAADSDSDAAA